VGVKVDPLFWGKNTGWEC